MQYIYLRIYTLLTQQGLGLECSSGNFNNSGCFQDMRVFLGSESISWTRRISDNLVVSPYLKQKIISVLGIGVRLLLDTPGAENAHAVTLITRDGFKV